MAPTINCDNCGRNIYIENKIIHQARELDIKKKSKEDKYIYGIEDINIMEIDFVKKLRINMCCAITILARVDTDAMVYGASPTY